MTTQNTPHKGESYLIEAELQLKQILGEAFQKSKELLARKCVESFKNGIEIGRKTKPPYQKKAAPNS